MEALQSNRKGETPNEVRQTTTAGGGERGLTGRARFSPSEHFTQAPVSAGLPLDPARAADRTGQADVALSPRRSAGPAFSTRRSRRGKHTPWPVA